MSVREKEREREREKERERDRREKKLSNTLRKKSSKFTRNNIPTLA